MPNWCENRLTITGDKTQLAKIKKDALLKIKKGERIDGATENAFSIAKLYPIPKELDGISSPPTIVSEKDYNKAVLNWATEKAEAKKKGKECWSGRPITQKMADDFIKRFGATDWYHWSVGHWGTKWDTNGVSRNKDNDIKKNKCLNYDFDTAWSPPTDAILKISEDYPKLTFSLEYCELGMCFSGTYVVKNGEVIEDDQRDGEVWEEYQCHHEKLKKGDFCDNCCEDIE